MEPAETMTYHTMNQLGAKLEIARMAYAMAPVTAPNKVELYEAVVELTRQVRAAERRVMAQALDLAECIPQEATNYRTIRELIHNLQALVRIEEDIL